MIIYSRVIDQPATEPVTLSETKVHLEYQGTAKDAFIESLIKTARQMCEAYAGLSFVTQQRIVKLDRFPLGSDPILIPYGPVQTIDSLEYLNDNGGTTTLTYGVDYSFDSHSGLCRIYAIDEDGEIDSWSTDTRRFPQAVSITYTAGYDELVNEQLPEIVKQAILLQVASMFENRQDEVAGSINMMNWNTINWNSKALLDFIRVHWNANII